MLVLATGSWSYANRPDEWLLIVVSTVVLGAAVWLGRLLPRSVGQVPLLVNPPTCPSAGPSAGPSGRDGRPGGVRWY